MKLLKLIHTIKYLKFVQLSYRLHYLFIKPKTKRTVFNIQLREVSQAWCNIGAKPISMLSPTQFVFLNHVGQLNRAEDWNTNQQEKLWLYNLHYFDDLNAQQAEMRQTWHYELINRWIVENPYAAGNAWEPYPNSLRIVNWVKWALQGNAFNEIQLQSLMLQAEHLSKTVEWHILANHLFTNAKALIFAGLFFNNSEAKKWLNLGLKIYKQEINEQVLADGANFELTPMYHAIFLEDLLDIYQLMQCYAQHDLIDLEYLKHKIQAMLVWLQHLSHPDGEIAFFNDAAFAIAANHQQLLDYAQALSISVVKHSQKNDSYLKDSGYIAVYREDAKLLIDVAAVGPNYQPGHAHADSLSFEMSLFGQRVFVNSGISQYGMDAERHRQRSTCAHNTVTVDDVNSSEIWAGFRVARRAFTQLHELQMNRLQQIDLIHASHNGYINQGQKVRHFRQWQLDTNKVLKITDFLEGDFNTAKAYFYLHPNVTVELCNKKHMTLKVNGHNIEIAFSGDAHVALNNTTWHPEFGKIIKNQCICVEFSNNKLETVISWRDK